MRTTPPLLMGLAGLLIAVGFACFLGLTAIQNEKGTRDTLASLQAMWDERVSSHSAIDQDRVEIEVQQDRLKLAALTDNYRQLHQLISICAIGLVIFSLSCFLAFRFGILYPLRKLEQSARDLAQKNLEGHIWGLDRDDAFGSLARTICDIRKATVNVSDMVVDVDGKTQHVRFEGQSAAVFSSLISDLQRTVENLTKHSSTLEHMSREGQESIESLSNVTSQQTAHIENVISSLSGQLKDTHSEWTEKLTTLFHQNHQIQGQSKQIVDQFTKDMGSLNQIAAATGARVAQTLQILSASDRDFKKAAQQSLETSVAFGSQTSDLMQKLQAATNLLRASGKVMSEATEHTRTRLNEAINSVSNHDQAIRAFLGDTAEKTDRITSLLEDVSRSAVKVSETVGAFDARMSQFEEKSGNAFRRIDESGEAISGASARLAETHTMMASSLEAMNGYSETLAKLLTSVRDEYASFSNEWKQNLSETAPVFDDLKRASDTLQTQLRDEWSVYASQSRELLVALEQDVRVMNARTEQVTQDTEKLISTLSAQTQRVSDNANLFDLQIANISLRLDDATANVLNSNKQVVETTNASIHSLHASVQEMTQRLGILSQLTGTLGAVAGQLGQIVPTLSDAQRIQHTAAPPPSVSQDPALLARFEEINTSFADTINGIRSEYNQVSDQIAKWVQMLTGGYKNLAEQLEGIDGRIDENIAGLKQQVENAAAAQITAAAAMASVPPPAPPINLGEELVPAMRLIHEGLEKTYNVDTQIAGELQQLKQDIAAITKDVHSTTTSLQNLGSLMETGFTRIETKESKPVAVTVDATRVESAAQALDQIMRKLQGQSDSVVGKLGDITQRLEGTSNKLQLLRAETPTIAEQVLGTTKIVVPPETFSEKANLDQLQKEIEHISALLDQFSTDASGFINPQGEKETLTPDQSKAFVDTVMATIIRLHHIAESIEKIGGNTPPSGGQDSKTG